MSCNLQQQHIPPQGLITSRLKVTACNSAMPKAAIFIQ